MAIYLADSSIWAWAENDPACAIAAKLADRLEHDEVATCPLVVLEALHRARTGQQYQLLFGTLFAPLTSLPVTATSGARAVRVQQELSVGTHGNHRRPAADFLLAAAAEEAGADVTLWFFDKDLRVICDHTGQPYEAETRA